MLASRLRRRHALITLPLGSKAHASDILVRNAGRFHELRKNHPKIASKRKVNESLYAGMGVKSGWFCGAKPLQKEIASIKVGRPCLLSQQHGTTF